jgi:hypothetical protein
MDLVKRIPDTPTLPPDALWAREAEDRLAAYRRGEIKALPLNDVLGKYMVNVGPLVSAQLRTSLRPPAMR